MSARRQALLATAKWLASLIAFTISFGLLGWLAPRLVEYIGVYGAIALVIGVPLSAFTYLIYRSELLRFLGQEDRRECNEQKIKGSKL